MTATLRIVLDQVTSPTDVTLTTASRELARALVATAPAGCEVSAIVPAGADAEGVLRQAVPGLAEVTTTALPRRELAAAWQLGVASGAAGGMIHAPTLLAPLVKHDRVHDHDQTVVTVWDLDAWEAPESLPKTAVLWQRAMLKRAAKHADAVVVPTHALAERLADLAPLGDRIRVIAGAAPAAFAVPSDEIGRRRHLDLPEGCLTVSGSASEASRLGDAFRAIARSGVDLPVVVIDAGEGEEPAIADLAAAAGVAEGRVHVRGTLEDPDRASVLGATVAFVAPSLGSGFPWRVVEALAVGVPVVAADSPVHREVIVDGGVLAAGGDGGSAVDGVAGAGGEALGEARGEALGEALSQALGSAAALERLAVLSADRGRAFSWAGAAERTWQLHAEL